MKLAVLMPAYNRGALIARSLESLLAHRDRCELDIIVVDDGSQDETREVVRQMARTDREIRLIEAEHGGVARARNIALDAVSRDTDLVSFLDSDDISPAGRFDDHLHRFAADPELDLTYAMMMLCRDIDDSTMLPAENSETITLRGISLSAGVFRAGFLKRIGPMNETLVQGEDMDFLMRCFEAAPRYEMTQDVAVYYRRHGAQLTGDFAQSRREFMRALHMSVKRRRENPGVRIPEEFSRIVSQRGRYLG